MTFDLPDNVDPEMLDRFICPVLDLVRDELDCGTNHVQVAIFLSGLASAAAHRDPLSEYALLTFLAKSMQALADQVRL